MDHGLELIISILEILEIEVSMIPRILEIRAAGRRRRAGGSRGCVVLPWIIFGTCFLEFPDILEILEICFFLCFGIFPKKTRAEISRRMHRSMPRDLSYETDSGPKTKTVSDPNFQVTAATAATSQQLSHLARALDHHAQGPNIPFGNPSLRYYQLRHNFW